MIYEIYTPQFPLNQFVESFIYYTNFNPAHSVDRFLPDGNINVVIDLTDYPKFIYDNHTLKEIQSCKMFGSPEYAINSLQYRLVATVKCLLSIFIREKHTPLLKCRCMSSPIVLLMVNWCLPMKY